MPASDWRAALPLPGSPPQALRSQLHSHDDDSNVMVITVTDDLPEGPILGIAGYCLPSPHHPREEGGENGESERGPPPLTAEAPGHLGPSGGGPGGPPSFSKAGT